MKNLNSEETLWAILPILVILGLLVASIIILPGIQAENRTKASEPKPTITIVPTVTKAPTPEIVCSSLYSPVCGKNGVTYPNDCEANQAGVLSFTAGACPTQTTPKVLPASN